MAKTQVADAAAICSDPRWQAVLARAAEADGQFFYAVKTTGVYCRPSCAARTPRPENVSFYPSAAAAEQAGFRPCRRCRPEQPPRQQQQAALIAALCRQIDAAEEAPSLAVLAASAQLSPSHLLRLFKTHTGVTPKAYASTRRAARLREALGRSDTVTEAIYQAGYASSGRFYSEAKALLGMAPRSYRAGASRQVIRFAIGACSLGAILVAASEQGICAIALGDQAEALLDDFQARFAQAELVGGDAAFEQLVAQVVALVEAPQVGLALPLDVRGTAFQLRVWQALRQIPAGCTVSYSELAARIGVPRAVRAMASACAANTLAVAIPCHRVVRSDGSLSGYRWGVERKRALLEREAEKSGQQDD